MYSLKPNKNIIIFSSKGNSAKNAAYRIFENFDEEANILSLNEDFVLAENLDFERIILVCPTYGDEEMERSMEDFLVKSNWEKHQNKIFSVCELGLYRGYMETEQGAGVLIRKYLINQGLVACGILLSVDSIPLEDFSLIDKWSQNILKFGN